MNSQPLLFQTAVSGGTVGIAAAAAFLLIFLGVAYVVFRMLRKTVKMAFRMAIVGVILLIAVVGSLSLWYFGSDGSSSPRTRPPAERRR